MIPMDDIVKIKKSLKGLTDQFAKTNKLLQEVENIERRLNPKPDKVANREYLNFSSLKEALDVLSKYENLDIDTERFHLILNVVPKKGVTLYIDTGLRDETQEEIDSRIKIASNLLNSVIKRIMKEYTTIIESTTIFTKPDL